MRSVEYPNKNDSQYRLVDRLFAAFQDTKSDLASRVVGATPSLCRGVECRAHEIWAFVKEKKMGKAPWVALDDWNLFQQEDGEKMVD